MVTFYIKDNTSKHFFGTKKEKKNVEKEIGSFAFMIDSLTDSQALVDYAEELGLTVDNLNRANYGDYITFGVDSHHDVSYEEYRSDIPSGVEIIKSSKVRDIVEAIEDMAEAKNILLVADVLREKTYRELATGIKNYKKPKASKKNAPRRKTEKCDCKVNLLTISDHFIINDVDDEIIMFKKPQDKVNVYMSY